jgi:uncharacterized membrane protein YfcA
MDFSLILIGFLVGVLVGLTSMGGAALIAPVLILVVGVRPVTAVGTDLVYGALTKIVGAWVHLRQGTVDLPVVKRLAAGSVPGGLMGALTIALLSRFVGHADAYVQRVLGVLLIVVAVVVVMRLFWKPTGVGLSEKMAEFLRTKGTVIYGALVGFCVGMTSVGSGTLLAPFLMVLYPSKTGKVVGTDVFHAAILLSVTGLAHSSHGGVEWRLVANLLAGSIPGVVLGSRLVCHVPTRPLRVALAIVLFCTGLRMA